MDGWVGGWMGGWADVRERGIDLERAEVCCAACDLVDERWRDVLQCERRTLRAGRTESLEQCSSVTAGHTSKAFGHDIHLAETYTWWRHTPGRDIHLAETYTWQRHTSGGDIHGGDIHLVEIYTW